MNNGMSVDGGVDDNNNVKGDIEMGVGVLILLFVWMVIGLAGFIMSIVCFGRKGSTSNNVIGLLLAVFFGPFYWIYYLVMPRNVYCGK